jgi:hypothetical protein
MWYRNISIDKEKSRARRLSEVIDEMPFEDRPDIFQVSMLLSLKRSNKLESSSLESL